MRAEIIAIGTELLLGQITNTNAQYLSQQCAQLGIDVYFQTVVGDNVHRLRSALELARNRADFVICTGGLGPTDDDLTKDVLADLTSRELIVHQPTLDKIEAYYKQRGLTMIESNKKQSYILRGSHPFFNENGMAVGLAVKHEKTYFIVLPGPPREMKLMFEKQVIPWINSLMDQVPLHSIILKFAGIGESSLEHELKDLIQSQQDPTIAPYAKEGEVSVRMTTRARTLAEAQQKMMPTLREIRSRLASHIYAEEDISLEQAVIHMLKERNLTISTAESCTGGLLGDLLTSVPGSSAVYKGGVICYTNEIKYRIVNVPEHILTGANAPGAISRETAESLANNILEQTGSDCAISITGVAGPDPVEQKPVGLVYFGIARKGHDTDVEEVIFTGDRNMIKLSAAKHALYALWKRL